MAACPIRVPATADPVMVEVPAKTTPDPGPLPVAAISHARREAGAASLGCTCRGLRVLVDVDDDAIRAFLLAEHLRAAHPGWDHLLLDDARTGVWSSLTADAAPVSALVITAPQRGETCVISDPAPTGASR